MTKISCSFFRSRMLSSRLHARVLSTAFACFAFAGSVSHAATPGTASAASAVQFEGVWLIDLKASGLPGYGKNPPQLTGAAEQERKKNQEARTKGDASFDLTARCSNPGMPRIMSLPRPIQIFARADDVSILFEWNHLLRQIHVDGKEHEVPYTTAAGVSTGKWENGKLIVKTEGRNSKTLLDEGIRNSESLTLTEAFTVSDGGKKLSYEVTMMDPEVLAKPWTRHYVYRKQSAGELKEDVCLDRLAKGELAVPKGF